LTDDGVVSSVSAYCVCSTCNYNAILVA